ncbi:Cas10/Cmr2 second palm domain-containing protein [Aphanothece minutissima]|uniref:Cas10/Cmr2 second palm domain-containing protein n=1 Tax=Aphanothece minutissima TaxID=543815 RepID=UPI0011B292AB|nr:type III-B CRISPR-associated protein Cas10/Cmr2 [Aphanothece minutissima]
MSLLLDMSIGPVQGFVAQSRRTRDLWGSSYLLSFLSAHAMRGISQAGGTIVRPSVEGDPLFAWVCAERQGSTGPGEPPRIGSVPNHFVAELEAGVDPAAVAQAGVAALEKAWRRVHEAVWERFVATPSSSGQGTDEIWARQTAAFWEVLWTAGDDGAAAGGLLARRKHWRSQRLPDEPGDKCTLMPEFQELSGLVRAQGEPSRRQQDSFWNRLRRDVGPLELRPDERLCAIALVKRLFPKVAEDSIGWELDVGRWPSTAGLAAVPWLQRVCQAAPPEAEAFAEELRKAVPAKDLKASPTAIPALAKLNGPLLGIDANFLQAGFLTDKQLELLNDGSSPEQRPELGRLLKELQKARDVQGVPFGSAPVFYALLLADGDRLGQLVGSLGGPTVGAALSAFTARVPGLVAAHSGVTVYAGGDDVLALLPLPGALACAAALADSYAAVFREQKAQARATLSAAVVLAHVRLPLGAVLAEAHHLLDDVAKDRNGRDSLAVAVLKRGGRNVLWSTTWRRPGGADSAAGPLPAVEQLEALAAVLRQSLRQPGVSSSLLYRLRDTLSLLCSWPQWSPGAWGAIPAGLDLRAFLRSEVLSSLEDQGLQEVDDLSERLTDLLLPLLPPARAVTADTVREVGVDALLLARFLAAPAQEDDL